MKRSLIILVILSVLLLSFMLFNLGSDNIQDRETEIPPVTQDTTTSDNTTSPTPITNINRISPTPPADGSVTQETVSQVNIYLISLEDQGRSGEQIGCGDSVVPVRQNISPTPAPLSASIERLLSLDEQFFGQSGFYNALYQSDLTLESAVVENGTATIRLQGNLMLGGVCDNPRVQAQLRSTALQFPTVQNVEIFLNGKPLEEVLSQR